ncbi:MAG: SpoIID/LytB domain-containing protein [Myxococcota bacterium]|jgi:hypothetical protein|nr:SpoIID/LytB domain-containing protein [Myxococcota bacterium]
MNHNALDARPHAHARPLALISVAVLLFACAEEPQDDRYSRRSLALQAYCTATVEMTPGDSSSRIQVDVETDYIPRVIMCENGGADFEALKAQAVAARTYLYYTLNANGHVKNGTVNQVYASSSSGHCPLSRSPSQAHFDAAAQTAGQVLMWDDVVICGFFVAGAIPSASSCIASSSDSDPTSTEKWVTYNWGKSGSDVTQTPLGWVSPSNKYNRGCKSQNGANCLSQHGWGYKDILHFYYGMDVLLTTAEGACIAPVACSPTIDADEVIIDERDSCFQRSSSTTWRSEDSGYNGQLYWTYVWDKEADCVGTWKLDFANAGEYELEAWIEAIGPLSTQAPYLIRHAGQEHTVVLPQQGNNGWLSLGRFSFAAGADQFVRLSDATGEPYTNTDGKRIVFDALRVRRYIAPVEDNDEDLAPDLQEDVVEDPIDALDQLPDQEDSQDQSLEPIDDASPEQDPEREEQNDDVSESADHSSDQSHLPDTGVPPQSRVQSSSDCACNTLTQASRHPVFAAFLLLGLLLLRRSPNSTRRH